LALSVILMGAAANVIARYIDQYRWIAWGGLAVILWVAVKMIYEGAGHVAPVIVPLFS
jgi:predicted tellurium resistance membrane protein TerC